MKYGKGTGMYICGHTSSFPLMLFTDIIQSIQGKIKKAQVVLPTFSSYSNIERFLYIVRCHTSLLLMKSLDRRITLGFRQFSPHLLTFYNASYKQNHIRNGLTPPERQIVWCDDILQIPDKFHIASQSPPNSFMTLDMRKYPKVYIILLKIYL